MATTTLEQWSQEHSLSLEAVLAFNLLFAVQLLAAVIYGVVFEAPPINLHLFLIPFLWITISVLAVWYTELPAASRSRKLAALAVSGGFFLAFLALSGAAGTDPELFEPLTGTDGFAVTTDRSLGWAPVLFYSGEWIALRIIPYQLIGYLALSYLIYVAILDVTRSAKAGLLGLALCPGCTAALFAPVFASAAGISSAFALFVRYTYEISTVFFVVAVALLYWEPTISRLRTATTENIPTLAGATALVVAWLHLFHPQHGVFRLIQYVEMWIVAEDVAVGTMFDPRPLAFTLSGLALFTGILLAYAGIRRKILYGAGIGLMLVFLVGYASWHTLLGHGAFWPHIDGHGHHDQWAVVTVVNHLLADPLALLSKAAELTLLVLLAILYRKE